MEDKKAVLRKVPLFKELTSDELAYLVQITTSYHYKQYTYIFFEGEEREAVFFIRSGVIKAYKVDEDGNEQVISLLKAGEMFPHVGFFDDSPYPATTEVIQDAEVLSIRIQDFDHLLMENPQIAIKVMKIMGQKLLQLQQRLQELISGDVQRRVINALLRLAVDYGKERENGVYIDVPITNQDFANMVGTSRESINRTLNQLKKDHLLDFNRKGMIIYDMGSLKDIH